MAIPAAAIGLGLQGISAISDLIGGAEKRRELRRQRQTTDTEFAELRRRIRETADASLRRAAETRSTRIPQAARSAAIDRANNAAAQARAALAGNRSLSTAARLGAASQATLGAARQQSDADAAFFDQRQRRQDLAGQQDMEARKLFERDPEAGFQYSSSRENQLAGEANQRAQGLRTTLSSMGQNILDRDTYTKALAAMNNSDPVPAPVRMPRLGGLPERRAALGPGASLRIPTTVPILGRAEDGDDEFGGLDADYSALIGNKPRRRNEGGQAVQAEPTILEPGEVIISAQDAMALQQMTPAEAGTLVAELIAQGERVPGEGMGDKITMDLTPDMLVISLDDLAYIEQADSEQERGERAQEVFRNYDRKAEAEMVRQDETGGQADVVTEIIQLLTMAGAPADEATAAEIESMPPEEQQMLLAELQEMIAQVQREDATAKASPDGAAGEVPIGGSGASQAQMPSAGVTGGRKGSAQKGAPPIGFGMSITNNRPK